ncbi:hypothetical protein HW555_008325 [Spodoptera exigua]|uniref:Carboxylesterase type B domain-containing protein n=1 Tax=Spodoptera exigua TaxID=7107 RepID=A0A835GF86_SPOEX|nr:hypothetical protein HW555_008325 [Spodoptera exigua]
MFAQVEVSQGILKGKVCETVFGKKYYSFEGIPYAKPPVGNLRFRAEKIAVCAMDIDESKDI